MNQQGKKNKLVGQDFLNLQVFDTGYNFASGILPVKAATETNLIYSSVCTVGEEEEEVFEDDPTMKPGQSHGNSQKGRDKTRCSRPRQMSKRAIEVPSQIMKYSQVESNECTRQSLLTSHTRVKGNGHERNRSLTLFRGSIVNKSSLLGLDCSSAEGTRVTVATRNYRPS